MAAAVESASAAVRKAEMKIRMAEPILTRPSNVNRVL